MIRLGHIDYANCYPIHAPLLDPARRPVWLRIEEGSPGQLNTLLAAGKLDVAPCSSIEYAHHQDEYRVLPGLCIGSHGPVHSIRVVSRLPWSELDGARVLLPTASATSRCLLKILLEVRDRVEPAWGDFEQETEDPLADETVSAALFIGDAALRYRPPPGSRVTDLGAEWTDWTGLPFVYALWQSRVDCAEPEEIRALHRSLLAARTGFLSRAQALAEQAAPRYGLSPDLLLSYWARLRYDLDSDMRAGLSRFYELAAGLGLIPHVSEIRFADPALET
ncbi:MAG: menaquinone biosynthesis protein [Gemmatimonadota bacterium]